MDRRRFTSFLGASLLVADSFAAQPAKLHRIGYLRRHAAERRTVPL